MPAADELAGAVASQVETHGARNRQLIARIVAGGGLLGSRRQVDLHFWSKSRAAAELLARALGAMSVRNVQLNLTSETTGIWSVEGCLETTVEEVTNRDYVESLVRLALGHDSEFDGWGTEL